MKTIRFRVFIVLVFFAMTSTVGVERVMAMWKNADSFHTFTIIHINDHHSHLEPTTIDLKLGGETTRTEVGGFAQIVSLIKEEQASNPNTMLLHAGDAITGTIYYSLFKGRSDAEVMNQVPWDAFVLGNHEFDDGDHVLKGFLGQLQSPVVAANVVPGPNNVLAGLWKPYVITEVNGHKVGIIGIDIVGKTRDSSNPGPDIEFLDEIETTRRYTDELTSMGVKIIIVLTHIGHKNALDLAARVRGVDVVVAGDSHTLLGDEDMIKERFAVEGSYPTMVRAPGQQPVAVVQAWEYSKVLGVVDATFNQEGILQTAQGRPVFPLADSFLRKDASGERKEIEGTARDSVYAEIKARPHLQIVSPDNEVKSIIAKYREEKDRIGKIPVGKSLRNIPGGSELRIPSWDGDHQKSHETAQLVAEASLDTLQGLGKGNVDGLIQNAGGVRVPINQGSITTEDVFTLLPFANTLVTMEMSGAEIKSALEDSIDYALSPQGSTGSFPYTAGLRYAVDLKKNKGSRVSDLEINKNGSWSPVAMNREYNIGANSYIAGGKDGYITLGKIVAEKKVDTYLEYAQVVIDYIKKVKQIDRPSAVSVRLRK